jgi:uncharacterized membrane protein YgcG
LSGTALRAWSSATISWYGIGRTFAIASASASLAATASVTPATSNAPLRASVFRFIRSACHPIRVDSTAQSSAVSGKAVSHSNGTGGSGSDRSAFHASNAAISAGSAATSWGRPISQP